MAIFLINELYSISWPCYTSIFLLIHYILGHIFSPVPSKQASIHPYTPETALLKIHDVVRSKGHFSVLRLCDFTMAINTIDFFLSLKNFLQMPYLALCSPGFLSLSSHSSSSSSSSRYQSWRCAYTLIWPFPFKEPRWLFPGTNINTEQGIIIMANV